MCHRRHLPILLTGATCALALAACGGSGPAITGQGTTATGNSSPVALSKCMRTHGVSNFPDPSAGPGGEGFHGVNISPGSNTLTVDGITFSGPVFEAAQKACKKLLPGGGGPPPPISAAQRKAAIAGARCMRTHGVPNFPDPRFPAGGGMLIQTRAGVDPQSPAFRRAWAACERR